MFNVSGYEVRFKYFRQKGKPVLTHCIIDDGIYRSTGESVCSDQDQFNKNIGRKVAMSRALSVMPRGYRKRFWDAYFEARHGKY